VEWYDLVGEPLPELPWQQVYIVGDLDGNVPIVRYEGEGSDNLPGGKTEKGESIGETISREVQEEINCEVLSWEPLGYQKLTEPDGTEYYQLRVFAKLRSLGDFVEDVGGQVIGHSLVSLDELNQHIKYGEVGDRLVRLAKKVK
jgi:8-oxo-dGTP pyrophosphatase MutT (NUDIX family)